MPQLVKDLQLVEDEWTFHEDGVAADAIAGSIVPLESWLERRAEINGSPSGFWVSVDDEPEDIVPYLGDVDVVAVNFPAFVDGRGLSLGALLRTRYQYRGELRAVGNVLPDLASYLHRCGFDAFVFDDPRDAETALETTESMSDYYQASVIEPDPPFRRVDLSS